MITRQVHTNDKQLSNSSFVSNNNSIGTFSETKRLGFARNEWHVHAIYILRVTYIITQISSVQK